MIAPPLSPEAWAAAAKAARAAIPALQRKAERLALRSRAAEIMPLIAAIHTLRRKAEIFDRRARGVQ
jgi:hypothetical protein